MASTTIHGGTQIRSGTITGDRLAASQNLSIADGTLSTHAVTLSQLQAAIRDQDLKGSVRAASTANGALATAFENGDVLDGVTLATGDRILLKDQTTASENGIRVVAASGAPTRAVDADGNSEVTGGATVWVNEGTTNGDTQWTLSTNDPITVDTTALTFMQTGGAQITVGGGGSLVKTGNQLTRAALTGDVTASADSNATTIANGVVSLAKQANLAANSVIANNTGSAATPTALGLTAAATASTAVLRDTNANTKVNVLAQGVTTTATAAGTTTLTVASTSFQQFTGTSTQTVVLPDATTLVTGHSYIIANKSTAAVQVNANGGGGLVSVTAGDWAIITLIAAGSAAGTWDSHLALSSTSGTGLTATNFVTRETPSGTLNGSNTTFTLANTPTAGTEEVFLNGILQEPGAGNDYTISGGTITYLAAPVSGDKIRVNYRK